VSDSLPAEADVSNDSIQGDSDSKSQLETFPAIGMAAAMSILENRASDEYKRQRRNIDCLEIAPDDKSWNYMNETLGGDPFDFLARFGYSRTRGEWIKEVETLLENLPPEDREKLKPGAWAVDEDETFPLDALPPVLRDLSHGLAELHGVPAQFPAAVAIAVTGAAAGRGIRLKTCRGMTTYPNLYVLIGMLSGSGKSTVMKPIFAPLFSYERKLKAEHASGLPRIEAELALVQKEIGNIQKETAKTEIDDSTLQTLAELKARETELVLRKVSPRLVVEDITSQKLAIMMEQNREVMASLSPDARGAGKILLGRHNEGSLDEDIYLKGFSSDSSRQDRVGRPGASLDDPALTIAWATQLDLFDQLFNSKVSSTSGLACRFLPIRIDTCLSEASYDEESTTNEPLNTFTTAINGLLARYHQSVEAHTISAAPQAREVISDYQREICNRISGGELARIRSFALRWAELAWRLALIFHCAENGEGAHLKMVSKETAASAVRVMKWFARHQHDLLNRGEERCDNEKLSLALAFVNRSPAGATSWDVFRANQTRFDDVADTRGALDALEDEGAITGEPSGRSRRFFRKSAPRRR